MIQRNLLTFDLNKMAKIFKSLLLFELLFIFTKSEFWNRNYKTIVHEGNATKRVFPANTSCLYGLNVPYVVKKMPICSAMCRQAERETLLRIYFATRGSNWFKQSNWNTGVSHCLWFGVLCDSLTRHVISIRLKHNNLRGNILSFTLKEIPFLFGLCFVGNHISGKLDKLLQDSPKYLLRISFGFNEMDGTLPGNLPAMFPLLGKIQLSGNNINGNLPYNIGDLADSMEVISIGETSISGSIPKSFAKLRNLWFLDFEALALKGDFTLFLNLTKLQCLHLSSNFIHGEIPNDIGYRYPLLREFLLQGNNLHGTVPDSIRLLSFLSTFNVARNKLRGKVPASLFLLNLKVLVLSDNLFDGFEPNIQFNATNLQIFMASNLKAFSCDIESIFTILKPAAKTLMQLDMSNANISGHLPAAIFKFPSLTFLKLGSNQITGKLPLPPDNVPYLTLLELEHNDLTGQVPSSFSRLLMLLELDLRGNRRMKGSVVSSYLHVDLSIRVKERKSDTCPLVRFSHNQGSVYVDSTYYNRRHCYCNEHYYGFGGYCYPCLSGAKCHGVQSLKGFKNRTFVANLEIKKGFWPFPNEENVTNFRQCPNFIFYSNICIPAQTCNCSTTRAINDRKAAHGIIKCNKKCLCAKGHSGRFCSTCIKGYYREGIRCIECPKGTNEKRLYGILFGATIAVFVVSISIIYISKWRKKLASIFAVIEMVSVVSLAVTNLVPAFLIQLTIIIYVLAFSSYLQNCTGLFKGAIFYIQILDTLISTTDIWSESVYSAQAYISSALNFHFSSLACPLPELFTLLSRNTSLLLLPIICLAIVWSLYGIWKFIAIPNEDAAQEMNFKCRRYCIVFVDLAYFPLVQSSLSVIVGCRSIENVSFMKNYVWIDCSSSYYTSLKAVAILIFVIYAIGIPVFFYIPLLYFNRENLSDGDSSVAKWLKSLITPYKPKYRPYMEVLMTLRRLLMAVLMTSFAVNEASQTFCIAGFLLLLIVFEMKLRPFRPPHRGNDYVSEDQSFGLENWMDIFMLVVILLSFISVGLSISHRMFSFASALLILTLISNGLYMFVFCFCVLYRLFPNVFCCMKKQSQDDNQRPLLTVVEDCSFPENSNHHSCNDD